MPIFSRSEVARHNSAEDAWIIIDDKVYDVTKFLAMHPGGTGVMLPFLGQDATEGFFGLHRTSVLTKWGPRLLVGELDQSGEAKTRTFPQTQPGELSPIPYAESTSPFQTESHKRFRLAVRAFVDKEVMPLVDADDVTSTEGVPAELYLKMGKAGILPCILGPGPHLTLGGYPLPGGLKPEDFDMFHWMVMAEELKRIGCYGYTDGISGGLAIGLPPVLNFGTPELIARIGPPVLRGEKRICLAISDPFAGSDVSNIQCTATKNPDGSYCVNGVKKWITNGMQADYFATAVITGERDGHGAGAMSMLLIERACGGVTTKRIKTSYTAAAGTAYVIFDNAQVPAGNLLGVENKGWPIVMSNFNEERLGMAIGGNRLNRLVVEECVKWASQRQVFGKPLISQPVIQEKIAHMIAQVESVQSWLELTVHEANVDHNATKQRLAGRIALIKLQQTRVAHFVADNAVQIFGGRGLTRTGMGRVIEDFQRSYKFGAVLGGAEEIMASLGVRQMLKDSPRARL